MAYFKFQHPDKRSENDLTDCPRDRCPVVEITITNYDNIDPSKGICSETIASSDETSKRSIDDEFKVSSCSMPHYSGANSGAYHTHNTLLGWYIHQSRVLMTT